MIQLVNGEWEKPPESNWICICHLFYVKQPKLILYYAICHNNTPFLPVQININNNNPISIDDDDDDAMNFKMNIQKQHTINHSAHKLSIYYWNNNHFLIKSSSRTPQTWSFFFFSKINNAHSFPNTIQYSPYIAPIRCTF